MNSLRSPQQDRQVIEVESRLKQMAEAIPFTQAEKLRIYHGSMLRHLGLTVPVQRQQFKKGYSFSAEAPERQLRIWDAVWKKGQFHETKVQALIYAATLQQQHLTLLWPVVRRWAEQTESWDASDNVSAIVARIFESFPEEVLPVLQQWNVAKNLWLRRQSVISYFYYHRSRKAVQPWVPLSQLIGSLIADPEHYVQKAVGWALREASTAYPDQTQRWITEHMLSLSSIAFQAAAKKLPDALRRQLIEQRKLYKKASLHF